MSRQAPCGAIAAIMLSLRLALPYPAAAASCPPGGQDVLIGGNNSVSDLADPAHVARLLAVGRTTLYASAFAINNMVHAGDMNHASGSDEMGRRILATFASEGPGMGEEFYDRHATPSLPSTAHNDGGALDSVDGPAQARAIGWNPSIMMMNIDADNAGGAFISDANLSQFATAAADIRRTYPSVRHVWPYIDTLDASHADWSTPELFWRNAERMIRTAGGVGIDIPVGISAARGAASLASVIGEIRWATANGLRSVVLVTPYSASPPAGTLGQFAFDADFAAHARWLVATLRGAHALPSTWVVSNYSPYHREGGRMITSNRIGMDTDPDNNSIAAVALWFARNAPTSAAAGLPVGSERPRAGRCAR